MVQVTALIALFAIGHLIFQTTEQHLQWTRRCSAWLLKILKITVVSKFEKIPNKVLIVSNHLSWLDPIILLQQIDLLFITSTDVKNHPFLGWITQLGACHFWDRKGQNLKSEVLNAQKSLKEHSLGLFPEGTTSNGLELLPFKSSGFAISTESNTPLQIFALKYLKIDGDEFGTSNHEIVAYYGGKTFSESLWNILKSKSIEVELIQGPQIKGYHNRKELCLIAQDEIEKILKIQKSHFPQGFKTEHSSIVASEYLPKFHEESENHN